MFMLQFSSLSPPRSVDFFVASSIAQVLAAAGDLMESSLKRAAGTRMGPEQPPHSSVVTLVALQPFWRSSVHYGVRFRFERLHPIWSPRLWAHPIVS